MTEHQKHRIEEYYRSTPLTLFHLSDLVQELGLTKQRISHYAGSLGLTNLRRPKIERYYGAEHGNWVGDRIGSAEASRNRIQKVYRELGVCQHCADFPAVDRHHKDGNPFNNAASNIALLCRRCHMLADGRLKKLVERPSPAPKPPKPCIVCTQLERYLRKGRCHSCNEFFRRNGRDRQPGDGPAKLLFRGEQKTVVDWASELGLSEITIRTRLKRGWSVEETLGTPVLASGTRRAA